MATLLPAILSCCEVEPGAIMSETPATSTMRDEATGVTRRELFQLGNVLALPVLMGDVPRA